MKRNIFYQPAFIVFFLVTSCNPPEYPPPVITEITPSQASAGETIIIKGSDFNLVSGIRVGDSDTSGVTTFDQIIAIVPYGAKVGPSQISVFSQYGSSNTISFTVTPPKPFVEKVFPLNVFLGDTLTIFGKALKENDLEVNFGNVKVVKLAKATSGSIKLIVPLNVSSGDVWVTHKNGSSNRKYVQVSPKSASQKPIIHSMTPEKVTVGEQMKIKGKNFSKPGLSVVFPSNITLNTAGFNVVSDSELQLTVPDMGVTGFIKISNSEGTSQAKVTVAGKPLIEKLLPESNPPGGPLLIYGKNFESVKAIKLDNNQITSDIKYYSTKDNEGILAVQVPGISPKEYTVTVEDEKKNSSNIKKFKVLAGSMPLPPGLEGIVIPNLPISAQAFSIGNSWVTPKGRFQFFDDPDEVPEPGFGNILYKGPDDPEQKTIGKYKKDGSHVYMNLEGKIYEGAFDNSFQNIKTVFGDQIYRMIMTPKTSGDQLEFIVPYYLQEASPAKVKSNGILKIKGKFLTGGEQLEIRENEDFIESLDINIISVVEGSVDLNEINIQPGKYEISISGQSNSIPLEIIN